jgi:8-oxo-dGTP pyrophosphatase MutT (NUDIX family)
MNELVKQLGSAERDQTHPNRRPKDAATLILVDRTGREPKVLLGRRHHGHVFMPGKFVFPGGRIDKTDRLIKPAAALNPQTLKKLMRGVPTISAERARSLALTAIRETFEETGLLLGKPVKKTGAAPDGPWAEIAKLGFAPDLSDLHFIARAITPPRRPRRFDTRFFSVDASAVAHRAQGIVHADAELVELVWLPIAEARKLDLPTITGVVLQELESRVAAGFGHDLPVPFYRMLHGKFQRALL